jgi:hypothetical protein
LKKIKELFPTLKNKNICQKTSLKLLRIIPVLCNAECSDKLKVPFLNQHFYQKENKCYKVLHCTKLPGTLCEIASQRTKVLFLPFFCQRSPTRKADKIQKRSIYFFAKPPTNALRLFAHFFRRLPQHFFSIENHGKAIFQKNRAKDG